MKQLEQEKAMLIQGLEAIEKSRDWYHKQLLDVQERQKQLGNTDAMVSCTIVMHVEYMCKSV